MKKLILIRHAEAEQYVQNVSDFDRKLTRSGEKDAAKMAALLLNHTEIPEKIISSTAKRAKTTAHIFTSSLSLDDADTEDQIYEANVEKLLKIVNNISEDFEVAALVGHNPGVSNLLYFLTGGITTMPTASWVEIELDADLWAEVSGNSGKLIQYQKP